MVKRVSRPFYSTQPKKKRRQWWPGIIGLFLTTMLVIPYMMGSDLEKYLKNWLQASNQENAAFHLELKAYQRHWISSEADLEITGKPLAQPLQIHFKIYHGPLCMKAGHGFRFGLGFLEGSLDLKALLGQEELIKLDGPIQLTAFIPYFSDRELRTTFPAFMINDKANNLVYHFLTLQGSLDSDGLLQLELPVLEVNYLDGTKAALLNAAVLRVQPRSELGSLSVKQVDIYSKTKEMTTLTNLVLQTNTARLAAGSGDADLAVNLHFDQVKGLFGADELTDLGPFECQLKVKGLQAKGVGSVVEGLKLMGTQGGDLTLQQGESLEKAWASLLSTATVFDLDSKLNTANGVVEAEFHGGFREEKVDSFYTQGAIRLTAELKEMLAKYVEAVGKDKSAEEQLAQPLALLLDLMKQDGQGFVTKVDVRDGRVMFNGNRSPG